MIAIVSLPAMGLWAFFFGPFPHPLRTFRLMVALLAILVLSVFVFLKQYFLNQQVVRVLRETDRSFENLQRLQTQIVHQEKLASLGEMVAGAAHEINAPLAAILDHTQSLSSDKTLGPEQVSMSRKIGQQASRTRELVADLLSFAQQNPVEKSKVDMVSLLQKVVQSVTLRAESKKIHVQTRMERGLPGITGNANELLRACLEITGNAMDELEEVGGGGITISAAQDNHEIVITFSDTGRGVREPNKVFDPFYTTKPIGKGTGLGLSAAYGVVQQHQGRITCCNNPEGGASFILRLPVDQAMAGS
jgi:two-component system NtrC family sensor kinase